MLPIAAASPAEVRDACGSDVSSICRAALDVTGNRTIASIADSILGPGLAILLIVVGAFIVIAMQNYLAQLGSWVTIAQGVVFVICVLAFRRGIVGELGRFLKKPL